MLADVEVYKGRGRLAEEVRKATARFDKAHAHAFFSLRVVQPPLLGDPPHRRLVHAAERQNCSTKVGHGRGSEVVGLVFAMVDGT